MFPHLLDGADLGHQMATLRHQIASRLDLKPDGMAEGLLKPAASRIPELVVGRDVHPQIGRAIRGRQPSPRSMVVIDDPIVRATRSRAPQTCERCSRSVPEPICMCRPAIFTLYRAASAMHVTDLIVPDAVLGLLATRIRLLAVPVSKTRVDPQRDFVAGCPLAILGDHVGRAAVDVDPLFDHQVERS